MSKTTPRLASVPEADPDAGAPPPDGLKTAGRLLWSSVLDGWVIDPWERLLLLQACRCVDRLDALAEIAGASTAVTTNSKGEMAPHPAIVEARQQSIVLTRLLASMRLPVGDEDDLTRPSVVVAPAAPTRPGGWPGEAAAGAERRGGYPAGAVLRHRSGRVSLVRQRRPGKCRAKFRVVARAAPLGG